MILKLVSELGLRYQPSAQADMQAHGARVALLAADIADVPPLKLQLAIARWVSFKPYLPKASELRAIIDDILAREHGNVPLQQWCDERNAWAARIGADWWYRVTDREMEDGTKRAEVEKLEGLRAIEARAHAAGRPIKPWKPEPGETEAIQARIARIRAENPDMTQIEFNRLVDRGRI